MLSHFPPGLSMWPALSNGKIHSHSEFISLDHCLVLALSLTSLGLASASNLGEE